MILPSLTTTAPNGPPHPFSTDSMASRVASWANCFLYSSLSISVVFIRFCFCIDCGGCAFVVGEQGAFVISEERGTDESGGVLAHITQISETLQRIMHKG